MFNGRYNEYNEYNGNVPVEYNEGSPSQYNQHTTRHITRHEIAPVLLQLRLRQQPHNIIELSGNQHVAVSKTVGKLFA